MKVNFTTTTNNRLLPHTSSLSPIRKYSQILTPQEKQLKQDESDRLFFIGSILVIVAGIAGWIASALGIVGTMSLYEQLSLFPIQEVIIPIILPALFLAGVAITLGWLAWTQQRQISSNLSEIVNSDTAIIKNYFSKKEDVSDKELRTFIRQNILIGNKNYAYQYSLLRHIHKKLSVESNSHLDKKLADQISAVLDYLQNNREAKSK